MNGLPSYMTEVPLSVLDLAPVAAGVDAIEVAHRGDASVALTLSDPFCVERHQRE